MTSSIINTGKLQFPFQTLDPFLFCVYHNDDFPAGNERMEAPRRGDGADFDADQPYRMYHGDRVPGFPQVNILFVSEDFRNSFVCIFI